MWLSELGLPSLDAAWADRSERLSLGPTVAAGGAIMLVWYVVSRWRQRARYPPGPLPLPVIGNVHTLISKKKPMWEVLIDMQEKYGDVFTVFIVNKPTVILGSLDAVREAFLSKPNDFAGRPTLFSFELFTKGGKDIALGQLNPVWKRQRKIAHAAFRKFASGKNLEDIIEKSFESMSAEFDKHVDTGVGFSPRNNISMYLYNIIGAMVFGKQFENDDKEFQEFVRIIDETNDALGFGLLADYIPIFRYIPTPTLRLLKVATQKIFKFMEDNYDEHVRTFQEGNPTDIVYHILQSIKDAEVEEGKLGTEGLTLAHYQMIILDIFSAGTDTSRYTLMWAVLYLVAYPEYQDKVHEELARVVGCGNPVKVEHRPQLPYIESFLHEVMRIRPLVPLALPHETTCDTSVGGYSVPKGTQVMPNLWSIHMNKKEWGDPEVFRPERFLDADGQLGPRNSSWLPFSTGKRVCVGEALAKAELHIALATICNRYHFAVPAGDSVDLNCQVNSQFMMPPEYNVVISKWKA